MVTFPEIVSFLEMVSLSVIMILPAYVSLQEMLEMVILPEIVFLLEMMSVSAYVMLPAYVSLSEQVSLPEMMILSA